MWRAAGYVQGGDGNYVQAEGGIVGARRTDDEIKQLVAKELLSQDPALSEPQMSPVLSGLEPLLPSLSISPRPRAHLSALFCPASGRFYFAVRFLYSTMHKRRIRRRRGRHSNSHVSHKHAHKHDPVAYRSRGPQAISDGGGWVGWRGGRGARQSRGSRATDGVCAGGKFGKGARARARHG